MASLDLARRHLLKLALLAAPTCVAAGWGDARFRFFSAPDGLHWSSTDGTRGGHFLPLGTSFALDAGSVAPDGRHLAYSALSRTGSGIWTVPIHLRDGHPLAGTPVEFLRSGLFDVQPRFSADGRQIHYASLESGVWKHCAGGFMETGNAGRMPRLRA